MTIKIVIPGKPIPKQRPRVTRRGTYDPGKPDEKIFQYKLKSLVSQMNLYETTDLLDWKNYSVRLKFQVLFPKSITKKAIKDYFEKSICPPQKKDVDNYCKFYLDACNGILWNDDRFIEELVKHRVFSLENESVTIWIDEFDLKKLVNKYE